MQLSYLTVTRVLSVGKIGSYRHFFVSKSLVKFVCRGTFAAMGIIRFMVNQPCLIVNRFRPRGANIYTCDREKDMNKP